MAAVTFASKLTEDGSLRLPREAVEALGLYPGDEIQVSVAVTDEPDSPGESDGNLLQKKFQRFFERLDTLAFERPIPVRNGNAAEDSLMQALDEKYRKLGFKW